MSDIKLIDNEIKKSNSETNLNDEIENLITYYKNWTISIVGSDDKYDFLLKFLGQSISEESSLLECRFQNNGKS